VRRALSAKHNFRQANVGVARFARDLTSPHLMFRISASGNDAVLLMADERERHLVRRELVFWGSIEFGGVGGVRVDAGEVELAGNKE
jgi:hypothetical protein